MDSAAPRSRMLDHVRATVGAKTVERAKILAELKATHIVTEYDDKVDAELELMLAHFLSGNSLEGYAVSVTGKSGAGKSTIVRRRLDAHPALQPIPDGYGNETSACLRVKTPAGCTAKSLGIAILRAAGYPLVRSRIEETEVWNLVGDTLKRKGIFIVFLDEFQHVLQAPNQKGVAHLANTVKDFMTEPEWPIWLCLCGVPDLLEFIERDVFQQMKRRAANVPIGDLLDPDLHPADDRDDVGFMSDVLELLAETCGLKVGIPLEKEFLRRLLHAGIWRLGMTIQIIKMAVERALRDDKCAGALRSQHFVEAYQRISNCDDLTNVFKSNNWFEIVREATEKGMLTTELVGRR